MLVICNGTFKSGSSWLHAIILQLFEVKRVNLSEIPYKYNPNLNSPTRILENQLLSFLNNEDYKKYNFVTKAHYLSKNTLEYEFNSFVKFIFIERDIKDAIVSHFFHFNNFRRINFSFNTYFNLIGCFKVYEIYLFNKRCKQNFPNELFFSFEHLKSDFSSSVKLLSKVLGLGGLTEDELQLIKERTSLERMRKNAKDGKNKYYPELGGENHKLFRKGEVGDWKNYFNVKQLKRIERISSGKSSVFIKFSYFLLFTFRRKIGL